MLKVVIVEDEAPIANDLKETLQSIDPEMEIIETLYSVEDMMGYFAYDRDTDLIFSDIQLGDGLSLSAYRELKLKIPIIFLTAYDEYALQAFDANGIAYVLKPFGTQSLQKALAKYFSLKSKFNTPSNHLEDALQQILEKKGKRGLSIIVRQGGKIIPLPFQDVALFRTNRGLTEAITFQQKWHIVPHSLDELEEKAGPSFFRANRQYIVNRSAIKDAVQYFHRKLLINFNVPFSEEVTVGKLKTAAFIDWLSQNSA